MEEERDDKLIIEELVELIYEAQNYMSESQIHYFNTRLNEIL